MAPIGLVEHSTQTYTITPLRSFQSFLEVLRIRKPYPLNPLGASPALCLAHRMKPVEGLLIIQSRVKAYRTGLDTGLLESSTLDRLHTALNSLLNAISSYTIGQRPSRRR